jgi:hypothetical protein
LETGAFFQRAAVPVGMSWMWTLAYGYHEDRSPTHGYEATREAAMAAFAKSWRREGQMRPLGAYCQIATPHGVFAGQIIQ